MRAELCGLVFQVRFMNQPSHPTTLENFPQQSFFTAAKKTQNNKLLVDLTPLPHTHTNILQTYKMAPNPTMGTNDSSSSSNNNNNNNNSKSTSSGVYNNVDDDDDDKEENDNLLLDDNKTMDGPIMKWAPSDLFKSYPRTYLTYHVVTSGYAYMV